jgi:hypothetical protein
MAQSYGGLCKAGQRGATCLSLLDDVLGWDDWDKLGVALALSFEPMKASISRAVKETLAPQLFFGIISTAIVTWVVLAANPEPVFTKSAAIVSMLMLAYLGIETFLEVVQASRELKWATDRATILQELELAAQRFADRVGPEIARVFVLAVTLVAGPGMVGGTALLASRLAMLPRLAQAAAVGASGVGIKLVNVGQVTAVVVAGSTITIALPTTAVAMASISAGSFGEGKPKSTPKFEPPTNPPQLPPTEVPPGHRIRQMPPTEQYPNGYWKIEKQLPDGHWQPIDPSTGKPGGRPQTHIPLPGPNPPFKP